MLLTGGDKILGRHLDTQINHLVSVVGQDDVHQVLADVVDIPLDRRQDNLAPDSTVCPVHVSLQSGDGEFHGFGGLKHFGDNQFVGVELAAHLGHTSHERPVDDV